MAIPVRWLITAAALLLASDPAAALSLADTTPLYFPGPGGYGFDAAAVRAASRLEPEDWDGAA